MCINVVFEMSFNLHSTNYPAAHIGLYIWLLPFVYNVLYSIVMRYIYRGQYHTKGTTKGSIYCISTTLLYYIRYIDGILVIVCCFVFYVHVRHS